MRTIVTSACFVALIAAASGTQVSVSAQALAPAVLAAADAQAFPTPPVGGSARGPVSLLALALQAAPATQPSADGRVVRRLTAEEAVRLAVENNLGLQIARFDPQIEDLNVLNARTGWAPSFVSTFQTNRLQQPSRSIVTGSTENKTRNNQLLSNFGLQQALPWGGAYDIGTLSAAVRAAGARATLATSG